VIERWSRDQVLALAPDASSQKAAQGVSSAAKWSNAGVTPDVVWGECKGSGAKPYRACVDLGEPAYRCNCPSRKFPCKHALGLLLLWSADGVPHTAVVADWVAEWVEQRRELATRTAARGGRTTEADPGEPDSGGPGAEGQEPGAASAPAAPGASGSPADGGRRAAQREERVAAGLSELERWLADQVRQGIAQARQTGPQAWADLSKRLIDAQAPGVAAAVSRLVSVLREEDWPGHLLSEYALMHLLAVGHARGDALPGPLRDTIRSRVGFPTAREDVLAGSTVRDEWDVIGCRDEEHDRLMARRVWLRGRTTGRAALVLSFAPLGQALDASLVTGTTIDADLAFYPGSSPLRALVARRHQTTRGGPPPGASTAACLREVAEALSGDPWLESWPVVLTGVVPARNAGWLLADAPAHRDPAPARHDGVPLHPEAGAPWRLIAVSGGHPLTVGAEWTPNGFRPLTTWDEQERVVIL
jgi:hypothetical protein